MRTSTRIAAAMAALAVAANLWAAQDAPPDLDALQRRLDAAKAQQTRDAEAARRAAAAQAAQQARMATLVIRTDAPCRLDIDGKARATLKVGETQTLNVLGGQQLIECQSTEEAAARYSQVHEVSAGNKQVLMLELAAQVQAHHATREREAAAAATAERERLEMQQASSAYQVRWSDLDNGILADAQTGLQGAQRDNGKDTNWNQARRYCEGLQLEGKGWRLPRVDELLSIYNPHQDFVKAGTSVVKVSPLFRLTGSWFWSSTQDGSSSAFGVGLNAGGRGSGPVSGSASGHALCARRPP